MAYSSGGSGGGGGGYGQYPTGNGQYPAGNGQGYSGNPYANPYANGSAYVNAGPSPSPGGSAGGYYATGAKNSSHQSGAPNPYANPYAAPQGQTYQQQQQQSYPTPAPPQPVAQGGKYSVPAYSNAHQSADYKADIGYEDEDMAPTVAAGVAGAGTATAQPSGGLSEGSVRRGFLTKVYTIVTLQIAFTGGVIACFVFIDVLVNFARDYWWLIYVMLVPTLITLVVLMCNSKKYPLNMALLCLFTVFESFTIALLCGQWTNNIGGWGIMGIFVCTALVMVLITIVIMITKADLSFLLIFVIGGIFAVGLAFFIYWIVSLATQSVNRWAVFGIALAGTIVIIAWICYDTSQIVLKYTPDMYIEAAVSLYLDFINLFQCLLCLVGAGSG